VADPVAGLVVVAPETVAGVALETAVVVADPGLAAVAPGTVVEADLGTVAAVAPETAVAGMGEGLLGTAVEEADLETVAEADPVAAVEADSGTAVVVVDIVVGLPPAQSSAVLTQLS